MFTPRIFNIQKFSIHDGPGIRTTVFFCGCPLRCRWCHNPEGLLFSGGTGAKYRGDGDKPNAAWSVADLVKELEKDRVFFEESGGGVTLSGGEPLAQDMGYIVSLTEELRRKGISVVVDTCGDVPYENIRSVLRYADLFLYDIKIMDEDLHIKYTGVSNKRILANLSKLGSEEAATGTIGLRLPLLAGVNDAAADMENIAAWLETENVKPSFVSLLPYHAYARGKYERRNLTAPEFSSPDAEHLMMLKNFWTAQGFPADVGGGIPDVVSVDRRKAERRE